MDNDVATRREHYEQESRSLKLNLGSGPQKLPGFVNVDLSSGKSAYPLDFPDESAEVIRASHLLEHFPGNDVPDVLADWVRVLKPGGLLKVAVPNFKWICESYLSGERKPLSSYLLGGQADPNDFHKALFDEVTLYKLLREVGLEQIEGWESEIKDCASYPVSLNLQGRKPELRLGPSPIAPLLREMVANQLEVKAKCAALMSVPRLGWQDNFGSCWRALKDIKGVEIPLWRFGGAFWEMGMQQAFNAVIKDGVEWIIAIDYDTIFEKADVIELLTLAALYPDADAIVPLQAKRSNDSMLFTMRDEHGKLRHRADFDEFADDLTPIHTGHFGLTLIKAEAVKRIPKPWFWSQPNADGEWEKDRVDADIYFWQKGQVYGLRIFQANKIRIGHLQLVVSWVDQEFRVRHQYLSKYNEDGKPEGVK